MDLRKLLDEQMGLYEEQSSCVVEEGLNGQIFQQHRKTFIDGNNGPVTIGTTTFHKLDCGHVVGSRGSQELVGKCQKCGKWMCYRCGAVRCSRCQVLLCPSCIKLFESLIYCRKCKLIALFKRGSWFLLRRLHEGLSAT